MRIVIAEPDPALADVVAFAAQRRGHQAVCVPGPERIFDHLPFPPTVAIVSLQEITPEAGELLRRIGARYKGITIFVTCERPKDSGPTLALRAGAHDVIQMPYNPFEVILRAETWVASRSDGRGKDDRLSVADLTVDLGDYAATKNGRPLLLTKLELRLLYCLCEHYPHLVPAERLLAFGWEPTDDPDSALIKTHISHIRKKLRDAGGVPIEIRSRQTLGYVLETNEEKLSRAS